MTAFRPLRQSLNALFCCVCCAVSAVSYGQTGSEYWESARGQFRDPITALAIVPGGIMVAGTGTSTGGGALYRSTDGGMQWEQMPVILSTTTVRAIFVESTGRLLAGAAGGVGSDGVYVSADAGMTWTRSSLRTWVYAFAGVPGGVLAATGSGVYRSTDGGLNWVRTGFTRPAYAVAVDSCGAFLAGTAGFTSFELGLDGGTMDSSLLHAGTVYRSLDSGTSWQEVYNANATASALLSAGGGVAFVAMGDRGVGRTSDGGSTWSSWSAGLKPGDAVICLAREESGSVLAGSSAGILYRLKPGSPAWEAVSSYPGAGAGLLVLAADGTSLVAGTDAIDGFLMRSTDRGATWVRNVGSLSARWILALHPTRDGGLVAGTLEGLFLTTDEGKSWRKIPGESSPVYAVEETQAGMLVAAAGYDGVFTSSDQGLSWSRSAAIPSSYYSRIVVTPAGTIFAVGSSAVQRSTDRGASWSTLQVRGGGFVFGSRSGVIFLRDSAGGAARSSDDGLTWRTVAGIGSSVYSMVEDSSGVVYAGTYQGVFSSADTGTSWKQLAGQETWCLAANAAGYLFRGDYGNFELDGPMLSKDGGISWRDIGTGLGGHSGITCYAILQSGRIFAGTVDGCVFRSSGSSLPALLSALTGTSVPGCGVRIDWTTTEENGLLGFAVERSTHLSGGFIQLTGSFVNAQGMTGKANAYSYTDSTAVSGAQYFYRLRQLGGDGDISYSRDFAASPLSGAAEARPPAEFSVAQNYPNPFNPSTILRYSLPHSGRVRLEVFTMLGQLVTALVDGVESEGVHEVKFNANGLASGIYLYRLSAGSSVTTRRMMLLK